MSKLEDENNESKTETILKHKLSETSQLLYELCVFLELNENIDPYFILVPELAEWRDKRREIHENNRIAQERIYEIEKERQNLQAEIDALRKSIQ